MIILGLIENTLIGSWTTTIWMEKSLISWPIVSASPFCKASAYPSICLCSEAFLFSFFLLHIYSCIFQERFLQQFLRGCTSNSELLTIFAWQVHHQTFLVLPNFFVLIYLCVQLHWKPIIMWQLVGINLWPICSQIQRYSTKTLVFLVLMDIIFSFLRGDWDFGANVYHLFIIFAPAIFSRTAVACIALGFFTLLLMVVVAIYKSNQPKQQINGSNIVQGIYIPWCFIYNLF